MKLKRVSLKNVGPHPELDLQIGPGLTALVGPNGSGKSTLLNSIYACLTNDFSRFECTKVECIRDPLPSGQTSYIQVEMAGDLGSYLLTRGLKPSNSRLRLPDETTLTKDGEIRNALESSLGLSRRLIDHYVFVGQWEMFSFLSADPAERAASFQHLCGVERAMEIYKLATSAASRDAALAETPDDSQVEALEDKIGELVQLRRSLTREARGHRDMLLPKAKRKEMREQVKAAKRRSQLKRRIDSAELSRRELASSAKDAQREVDNVNTAIRELRETLTLLEPQKIDAEDKLQDHWNCIEQRQKYDAARKELKDAERRGGSLPSESALESQKSAAADVLMDATVRKQEAANSLRRQTAQYEKLKLPAAAGDLCPTCGQSIKAAKLNLENLKNEIDELTSDKRRADSDYEKAKAAHDELLRKHDARRLLDKSLGTLRSTVSSLEAQLKDTLLTEPALKSCQEVVADYDRVSRELATIEEAGREADRQATVFRSKLEVFDSQLAVDRSKLSAMGERVSRDVARKMLSDLKAHRVAISSRGRIRTRLAEVDGELKLARSKKLDLETSAARVGPARKWLSRVEQFKQVCHWDKAPKVVVDSCLRAVEEKVNTILQSFESPFYVRVGADSEEADQKDVMSFLAVFPGQQPRSARRLSGGQKVVLAMCFRLAVHELFASSIGLLVLDEPAAGLDADNVEKLQEALLRFSSRAKETGLQFLVSTHEDRIMKACDSVIDLRRP